MDQSLSPATESRQKVIIGTVEGGPHDMRNMGRTIDALKEAGLRGQVKVMVGGAPVTRDFAEQIGADGSASSAPSAVDLAKSLVGLA